MTQLVATSCFGGVGDIYGDFAYGDTWTWDGTDWMQHAAGSMQLSAHSGPPGKRVLVPGSGFLAGESVNVLFVDSVNGNTLLDKVQTDATGAFKEHVTIPAGATPGVHHVKAKGVRSGQIAGRSFTVT